MKKCRDTQEKTKKQKKERTKELHLEGFCWVFSFCILLHHVNAVLVVDRLPRFLTINLRNSHLKHIYIYIRTLNSMKFVVNGKRNYKDYAFSLYLLWNPFLSSRDSVNLNAQYGREMKSLGLWKFIWTSFHWAPLTHFLWAYEAHILIMLEMKF